MTRETKFSLIVGFTLILVVGVLLSDHFSGANRAALADVSGLPEDAGSILPPEPLASGETLQAPPPRQSDPVNPLVQAPPDSSRSPLRIDQGRPTSMDDNALSQRQPFSGSEIPSLTGTRTTRDPLLDDPNFTPVDPSRQAFEPRFTPPGNTPSSLPPASDPVANQPPVLQPPAVVPDAAQTWHTVKKDESLMTISRFYYGSVRHWRKLVEANTGRVDADGGIRIGARILIPRRETITGEPTAELVPPPKATPGPSEGLSARTYTVKAGDTLSRIAQRELGSKSRANEIVALNRATLDDPDDIRIGMVLRLPGAAIEQPSQDAPRTKPAADRAEPTAPATTRTYTIQAGDTLGKIAARELGSARRVEDIMSANPKIEEEDQIFAGMVITLPAR